MPVQVINDPYRKGGLQAAAAAFGQGLGEQIPKEVDRYRLSQGLENLGKEAPNLSPLQQLIKAYQIPGFTAEHAYNLVPLLQQEAKRREAAERVGGMQANKENVQPSFLQQNVEQPQKGSKIPDATIKPIESSRAEISPFVRPSYEERIAAATKLSQENPQTYRTPQEALVEVDKQIAIDEANFREQQGVAKAQTAKRNEIQNNLFKYMGIEQTASDVPGTIQTRLVNEAESILADPKNRLSEKEIIRQVGEKGKNLVKQINNLNTRGNYSWYSGEYTPSKIDHSIQSARKAFEDVGGLEEFKDILKGKFGLSEDNASYYAYPPSQDIKKVIKQVPKISIGGLGLPDQREVNKISNEVADKISNALNTAEDSKDSISSILKSLEMSDLDRKVILKRLQQNAEAGIWKPNARQERELSEPGNFFPSLGDILLNSILRKKINE